MIGWYASYWNTILFPCQTIAINRGSSRTPCGKGRQPSRRCQHTHTLARFSQKFWPVGVGGRWGARGTFLDRPLIHAHNRGFPKLSISRIELIELNWMTLGIVNKMTSCLTCWPVKLWRRKMMSLINKSADWTPNYHKILIFPNQIFEKSLRSLNRNSILSGSQYPRSPYSSSQANFTRIHLVLQNSTRRNRIHFKRVKYCVSMQY